MGYMGFYGIICAGFTVLLGECISASFGILVSVCTWCPVRGTMKNKTTGGVGGCQEYFFLLFLCRFYAPSVIRIAL